jgi:uncharacterized membrane protein
MKHRIWELDALRGACILGMIAVHLVFDLQIPTGPAFAFVQNWGGVLFFLLSGLCATLGSRPLRRGAVVLGAGLLCTAVTWIGRAMGMLPDYMVIRFGVLHCLGLCMILWPVFRKLPWGLRAVLGSGLAVLGIYLTKQVTVSFAGFAWLGLLYPSYSSADYFPLLPYLGFFLLGSCLGNLLYRQRASKLPQWEGIWIFRALQWCGRYSLFIYLLHQPLLMLLFL